MKRKARIIWRIYIIVYLFFLLETRGFYISETENAGLLVLLPVIIPWCFTNKERIIEKWKSERLQDVIIRIFLLASFIILIERQVEFFGADDIISVLIALMLTVIVYFAKMKNDLILINHKPYTKFFLIFAAEIFAVILTKAPINAEIIPESFSNITFPEVLKVFIGLVVFLPLVLFLNGVRTDCDLQPAKRAVGSLVFFLIVLLCINYLAFIFIGVMGLF